MGVAHGFICVSVSQVMFTYMNRTILLVTHRRVRHSTAGPTSSNAETCEARTIQARTYLVMTEDDKSPRWRVGRGLCASAFASIILIVIEISYSGSATIVIVVV